jgi:hypothetical protein
MLRGLSDCKARKYPNRQFEQMPAGRNIPHLHGIFLWRATIQALDLLGELNCKSYHGDVVLISVLHCHRSHLASWQQAQSIQLAPDLAVALIQFQQLADSA